MNLNIKLINGAHFECLCYNYLLKNIFPEITNIYYKNYSEQAITLCISANLDKKLNGKEIREEDGNRCILYNLDNKIDSSIPYIFWTGEPFNVQVKSKNNKHKYIVISSLTHNNTTIKMPFACFWYINFYVKNYLNKFRNKIIDKPYLLAFCSSNPTKERVNFMKLFIEKSQRNNEIYCLGKCNNFKCKQNHIKRGSIVTKCLENLIDEYSKFKFVIAIENCERKGYLSEKIICAFIAGSIPIYWGDHEYAKKLFNPKSFICIRDYENVESCIDYILNMSNKDIENMLKEPMFVDNIPPPEFDITNFEEGTFYGELKKKIRDICLNPI